MNKTAAAGGSVNGRDSWHMDFRKCAACFVARGGGRVTQPGCAPPPSSNINLLFCVPPLPLLLLFIFCLSTAADWEISDGTRGGSSASSVAREVRWSDEKIKWSSFVVCPAGWYQNKTVPSTFRKRSAWKNILQEANTSNTRRDKKKKKWEGLWETAAAKCRVYFRVSGMITAGEINDLFSSLFVRTRRRNRGDISKLSRPTEMVFFFSLSLRGWCVTKFRSVSPIGSMAVHII